MKKEVINTYNSLQIVPGGEVFRLIYEFNNGVAWAIKKGQLENTFTEYSLIDEKFNIINSYTDLTPNFPNESEVLIAKNRSNKCGCIDRSGESLISFEYSSILPFKKDTAVAIKKGKYGCINKSGDTILPFEYDYLEYDVECGIGYFHYAKKIGMSVGNCMWTDKVNYPGFLDIDGNELRCAKFTHGGDIKNVLLENPNVVLKQLRDISDINPGSNEFYIFKGRCNTRVFKMTEDLTYECFGLYSSIEDILFYKDVEKVSKIPKDLIKQYHFKFTNGFARVFKFISGKYRYSFFNLDGDLVLKDYKYDDIYPISSKYGTFESNLGVYKLAKVKSNKLYGLIDITGRELIPCSFKMLSMIGNGLVFVKDMDDNSKIIKL